MKAFVEFRHEKIIIIIIIIITCFHFIGILCDGALTVKLGRREEEENRV